MSDLVTRLSVLAEDDGDRYPAHVKKLAEAAASRIAALEAQLAERAGGVKVRDLEWKTLREGESYGAVGAAITYRVVKAALSATAWSWYRLGAHQNECESFDAARAAAQADYERRILSALSPAPEAQQEAARIGNAVLGWMIKYDLLDGDREYYVDDVLAVLNDLTPSACPAEQAVTEAMRGAASAAIWNEFLCKFDHLTSCHSFARPPSLDDADALANIALKAAMEAGR